MKKTALFTFALFSLPFIASAQDLEPLMVLIQSINVVVSALIPLAIAVALLVFFYGLIKYLWGGGGDKGGSKSIMIWGLVALFVMVSVWGIIALAQSALGIPNAPAQSPAVPGVNPLQVQ